MVLIRRQLRRRGVLLGTSGCFLEIHSGSWPRALIFRSPVGIDLLLAISMTSLSSVVPRFLGPFECRRSSLRNCGDELVPGV